MVGWNPIPELPHPFGSALTGRPTLGDEGPVTESGTRPATRRWHLAATGVKLLRMDTESAAASPSPQKSKLTGGQKWMIAGLLVLQIPSSLIFYPVAAIFAITGILAPIAMLLMGIGTLPFSFAMKCKQSWQGGGVPAETNIARQLAATGGDPG